MKAPAAKSLHDRAVAAAYRAVKVAADDPLQAKPWIRLGYVLGWQAGYRAAKKDAEK